MVRVYEVIWATVECHEPCLIMSYCRFEGGLYYAKCSHAPMTVGYTDIHLHYHLPWLHYISQDALPHTLTQLVAWTHSARKTWELTADSQKSQKYSKKNWQPTDPQTQQSRCRLEDEERRPVRSLGLLPGPLSWCLGLHTHRDPILQAGTGGDRWHQGQGAICWDLLSLLSLEVGLAAVLSCSNGLMVNYRISME